MARSILPPLFKLSPKHLQLLRFAVVGTVGFAVDSGALQLLVSVMGWNVYAARVVSFLLAAFTTWLLNRSWTFEVKAPPSPREWSLYTVSMLLGAAINYSSFALSIHWLPLVARWPVLGVAIGSVCGMGVNFIAMQLLFSRHPS